MDNCASPAYDVLYAAEPTPENFEAMFYEGMQEVMNMCDQFDATIAQVADTILVRLFESTLPLQIYILTKKRVLG